MLRRNMHLISKKKKKKNKKHVRNITKLRLATREEIKLSYRAEKRLNKLYINISYYISVCNAVFFFR